jgi:hypothetical protein
MKASILLIAFVAMIMAACTSDKTRSFIPGTYVNSAGSEYSVADDTLFIEPSGSNNFLIHRKTGFNLIEEGKKGERQHETEQWNAVYDEGTKALTETRKGKIITFDPESKTLKVGKREYRKLD